MLYDKVNNMHYVYLIKIKNRAKHSYYIGYTSNLQKRLLEHQESKGKVELSYYEAYREEKLARIREKRLKYFGSAWRGLKQRLSLA
jgi:predicted GIY-YIG superfamily endonuclease